MVRQEQQQPWPPTPRTTCSPSSDPIRRHRHTGHTDRHRPTSAPPHPRKQPQARKPTYPRRTPLTPRKPHRPQSQSSTYARPPGPQRRPHIRQPTHLQPTQLVRLSWLKPRMPISPRYRPPPSPSHLPSAPSPKSLTRHKRNGTKSTVPTALIAQYKPAKA